MTPRNPTPGVTRFQFDTVFASDNVRGLSGGGKKRSTFAADEVENIRKEALATGKQEALAEATHAQAVALSAIAQSTSVLIEQFDRHIECVRQESAALALAVARKLAGGALSIAPQLELESFLSDCLHRLYREARLVVTVTPDNADYLRSRIEDIVTQNGFSGRVVIMPDPAMGPGDCRIEWADGGIEKNLEATFASIEERLRQWQPSQFTEGEQS